VLAKEILDTLKFKSLASKTTRQEILKLFSAGDLKAFHAYLLDLAEKRRGAASRDELDKIKKKINEAQTADEEKSLAVIKTGMIEVVIDSKINEQSLVQQSCLLQEFLSFCRDGNLEENLKKLIQHPLLINYLKEKSLSPDKLCMRMKSQNSSK
jgi:hypothetical protein